MPYYDGQKYYCTKCGHNHYEFVCYAPYYDRVKTKIFDEHKQFQGEAPKIIVYDDPTIDDRDLSHKGVWS